MKDKAILTNKSNGYLQCRNTVYERHACMSEGRKKLAKDKINWAALFKTNNLTRARRNVAQHYYLKDDLYRLFLDDDLQYSCEYWTDTRNSLEQAQLEKKAHIAAKLALEPGQRVLDIVEDAWDDNTRCAGLVLDGELVPVQARPVKAFQGWRYLQPHEAPADLGPDGAVPGADGLPDALLAELRLLCLI